MEKRSSLNTTRNILGHMVRRATVTLLPKIDVPVSLNQSLGPDDDFPDSGSGSGRLSMTRKLQPLNLSASPVKNSCKR